MAQTVSFGEIMMRLATPGFERLVQATSLNVSYAGAEASVAVSLAAFGHQASFVTALPEGALGDAAVGQLRYYGVDTSPVLRRKDGRMGVYFLEAGASQRASKVIYDRAGATIAVTPASAYDWPKILGGKQALHLSGITPALSDAAAEATRDSLATARKLGLFTSLDLNYRAKLWSRDKARAVIEPLLANVDLLVGNEEDAENVLGISAPATDVSQGRVNTAGYEHVARAIRQKYGCRLVAITLRESESASINHWSGCLLAEEKFLMSRRYTMHIVDRVGAGDAFSGGLVSSILDGEKPEASLEFAVAASCLKHSIPGDFNKVTKEEVRQLVAGGGSGRVVR
jgi:2-dehydro-3-deoxygluconokinase